MTPLQVGASFNLAKKRVMRERAETMAMMASAFRAKGDDLNMEIKKLLNDAHSV